ncbi:MAG TPA: APC family permease [Bacillota bacterium]
MSSPAYELTSRARRVLFGRPKRTDQQHRERLSIGSALAVFSADGLSSVAYATEEILYILIAAGTAATVYSLPIGLAIVALVLIVARSYSQTIRAYPSGGGSYIVSRSNLGTLAGLTAGAALLIDYILTVAVSTAAGIAAMVSAVPALRGHEVVLELLAIWVIALVNMRGARESGFIFSIPTYAFVISTLVLIGFGLLKVLGGDWHPVISPAFGFGFGNADFRAATNGVTLLLILRAFSSGCTALTGLEAVSNGVQAFRPPETRNAIVTMNLERTLLYTMFAGITLLAFGFGALPREGETVMSQIARTVFGRQNPLYYVIQAATAMILLLAANTAYADFPRLTGFMARDGFLPRRFANRGDTLVYNYGVTLLALLASVLVVVFRGSTHLLIPLYAVGVFTAFTLSQTGMVVHWVKEARKTGESPWIHWWSLAVNALGAVLCAIVLVIIGVTKFTHGAWIVLVLVPLIVAFALRVKGYYVRFKQRVGSLLDEHLTMDDARRVKTVLTIGRLSPVIDHSLRVARRISPDMTAVYVAVDPEDGDRIKAKWDLKRHHGVPLVVLNSPYREVVGPLRNYLDGLRAADPGALIQLLVPIVVTNEPFDAYLHNGTADLILREFRYTEGVIVTIVPFYVDMRPRAEHALAPARHS